MKRSHPPLFPALLALAVSGAGLAGAAGMPAGTVIRNQASVSADPLGPDQPAISVLSNLVETVVSPVCSASVTPDGTPDQPGQSVTLLPTDAATFTYRLTNSGNTVSTYDLRALIDGASAFIPAPVHLYLDADDDGTLGAAERVAETTRLALAADAGATLFVVAGTGEANRGDAYVNLSVACPGGTPVDRDNVSRLRVGPPPAITVTKTFTPALVKPGDTTTVTVVARNDGLGASRSVMLSDTLSALAAQGLSYVPGSASAVTGGTSSPPVQVAPEYTTDGSTSSVTEPALVSGVRAGVDSLAPAQTLTLTFRMLAGAGAENRVLLNTAAVSAGGVTTTGNASLDVRYLPAVALGPVGDAGAPEGTPADSQNRPFVVVGQQGCFDHTLGNTGDVADRFRLTVTLTAGQAAPVMLAADGQPLAQPVFLQPGQSVTVRVCYAPGAAGPLQAVVTATGDRGAVNATTDVILKVEAGQPTLTKTSSVAGTVRIGDTVTYTLKLNNPYTVALTAALAQDVLSGALTFVSVSGGGLYDPAARAVRWDLGTLQPGEERLLTLVTTVSAAAVDGTALANSFTLSSAELRQPAVSNTAQNPVWSAPLVVVKTADSTQATYGDKLTYTLAIQNLSKSSPVTDAVITDTLPAGLSYLPGSSTLAGAPLADPQQHGQVLVWTGRTVPGSGEIRLGYAVRVTPEATGDLVNTVTVQGQGGDATSVGSNTATVKVRVSPLNFAPLGEIVGSVYLDRNRDGRFQRDSDLPLARARVILAGGRVALTDDDGRYHFAAVTSGSQALRLDPASVPYDPEVMPMEGGLSGTQTVRVNGLTSVDFPLAPVSGDIQVLRRTDLSMGGLRVFKTVHVSGHVYSVQLTLTTPVDLPGFVLSDPLPAGALLQGPGAALGDVLRAGETVVTYRFTYDGERGSGVTDPSASWRY